MLRGLANFLQKGVGTPFSPRSAAPAVSNACAPHGLCVNATANHPVSPRDQLRFAILLIDGDRPFCDAATDHLVGDGYRVEVVHRATDALDKALASDWHAIVLNVALPDLDGLHLLSILRRANNQTPVILVTDHANEAEEIAALESGADDYLPKDGSNRRLLARLQALLRRTGGLPDREIVVGELCITPELQQVVRGGCMVPLTPGEFAVLWSLARTPGQVKTRSQLFAELRHRQGDASYRTLDVQVSSLRRKLGDEPRRPRFIRTVHGAGYMLVDPNKQEAAPGCFRVGPAVGVSGAWRPTDRLNGFR